MDSGGLKVAGISASGSAAFKQLTTNTLYIKPDSNATDSATLTDYTITNNATAGKGKVPAGMIEVTILNSTITPNSLIYITPTSSTGAYNLYLKNQENGKFVVGFDNPTETDITFNWWVVGLVASP